MTTNHSMQRAVLTGPREVELEVVPLAAPEKDEVLARVHSSALCTFEQRAYIGMDERFYPLLGGHELSGIVEAIGSQVQEVAVGDKVAISAMDRCGTCYSCRRGYGCENVWFKKGVKPKGPMGPAGLSTHKMAKEYQVYKLRPETNLLHAALTEPLACVLRSVKKTQIGPGDNVAILGGGVMGILHTIVAKGRGASVIVSEPDEKRRGEALSFGASHAIDPTAVTFSEAAKEITNGRGVDVVIVAMGNVQALEDSVDALAHGGRLSVYARMFPRDATISLSPNLLHDKEIILTGTISQNIEEFQQAAEMIGGGAIDMAPVISSTYPMESIKEAFEDAISMNSYRVVVNP